jgi:predicted metalloprotease with PDZ domain
MRARVTKGLAMGLAALLLVVAGGMCLHAARGPGTQTAAEITMLRADGSGPAERAGLAVCDQILEVNGTPVTDRPTLLRTLGGLGDRAVLLVRFRQTGEVRKVKVWPDPHLGIHFKIVEVPVPPPPREESAKR